VQIRVPLLPISTAIRLKWSFQPIDKYITNQFFIGVSAISGILGKRSTSKADAKKAHTTCPKHQTPTFINN
jgi:hypothetical protein